MADTATATHASLHDAWRTTLADVAVVTVTPFAGGELQQIDIGGLERNLAHRVEGAHVCSSPAATPASSSRQAGKVLVVRSGAD